MMEFNLPGMHCQGCVRRVTQALLGADPLSELQVDLAQHRVQVSSTLEREALAQALVAAGFVPEETPAAG